MFRSTRTASCQSIGRRNDSQKMMITCNWYNSFSFPRIATAIHGNMPGKSFTDGFREVPLHRLSGQPPVIFCR